MAKLMISLLVYGAGCVCFIWHTFKRVKQNDATRKTSYCPLVCFALASNVVLFQWVFGAELKRRGYSESLDSLHNRNRPPPPLPEAAGCEPHCKSSGYIPPLFIYPPDFRLFSSTQELSVLLNASPKKHHKTPMFSPRPRFALECTTSQLFVESLQYSLSLPPLCLLICLSSLPSRSTRVAMPSGCLSQCIALNTLDLLDFSAWCV